MMHGTTNIKYTDISGRISLHYCRTKIPSMFPCWISSGMTVYFFVHDCLGKPQWHCAKSWLEDTGLHCNTDAECLSNVQWYEIHRADTSHQTWRNPMYHLLRHKIPVFNILPFCLSAYCCLICLHILTDISSPSDHTGLSGWNRLCAISKVSVSLPVCLSVCLSMQSHRITLYQKASNTHRFFLILFHFVRKKQVCFEITACVTCVTVWYSLLLYVIVLTCVSASDCVIITVCYYMWLCYCVLLCVIVLQCVTACYCAWTLVIVCYCILQCYCVFPCVTACNCVTACDLLCINLCYCRWLCGCVTICDCVAVCYCVTMCYLCDCVTLHYYVIQYICSSQTHQLLYKIISWQQYFNSTEA